MRYMSLKAMLYNGSGLIGISATNYSTQLTLFSPILLLLSCFFFFVP